jgi:hypothetical protein
MAQTKAQFKDIYQLKSGLMLQSTKLMLKKAIKI